MGQNKQQYPERKRIPAFHISNIVTIHSMNRNVLPGSIGLAWQCPGASCRRDGTYEGGIPSKKMMIFLTAFSAGFSAALGGVV